MITKQDQLKKNTKEKPKPVKFRKCRYCKEKTVPYGSLQPFCFKDECIKAHNTKTRHTIKRTAIKQFKSGDIPHLTKVAQQVLNKYIRKRDEHLPCVSCGYDGGVEYKEESCIWVLSTNQNEVRQWHAGHLKPVGGNANLRFNEDNVHKQCSICNNHKSGNVGEYEKNLIIKIGKDRVDALDTKVPRKYTVKELQEIIKTYKQKYKEIT